MTSQTVTVSIPEPLFRHLKEGAERRNRSVENEIVERLAATVPASGEFLAVGTPEWGRMNQRRAALIHKKNRDGLSEEEMAEYQHLQELSRSALESAFPVSTAAEERLERLEARLQGGMA